MIQIDGSQGEGGGQVLRSSLALSMVTGKPFEIDRIRARRRKPGLMRQHLTAVQAATQICDATTSNAVVGSTHLRFEPGPVRPGDYHFSIGTAGSTTLVLQAILPALLVAEGSSSVVLEGGTHNPMAPPFPFLAETLLPQLRRLGARVEAELERPGFFPAGGGKLRVEIEPCAVPRPFELYQRGEIRARRARSLLAHLSDSVGERELRIIKKKGNWLDDELEIVRVNDSAGPGNVLVLQIESDALTETFTGFGEYGVRAELVAQRAYKQLRRYLELGVPVGEYLADQMLVPLAMAGGGGFTTLPLSRHTQTQIRLIENFLDVSIRTEILERRTVRVTIES